MYICVNELKYFFMKAKFTSILKDKCKDFGLTEKAINDLVELGIEGLTEESSDEDFSNAVERLVPYARLMQKEITRKTTKPKPQSDTKQSKTTEGEENEGAGNGDEMPAWAKAMQASFEAMKAENEQLKATARANDRKASINARAKEIGIPEALMKHYSMSDDADIEAELTSYKQELINSSLLPKDATHEQGSAEASMKESAMAFAKTLADK